MTVVKNNSVAQLEQQYIKGRSLWRDAWERLIRNRAAVLGLIVIIVNILAAIFASEIAPYHFATQTLEDNYAAPRWIMSVFGLPPKSAEFTIRSGRSGRGWSFAVATGDQVSRDTVIMQNTNGETRTASTSGTIFVDGNTTYLVPMAVDRFEIPPGWQVMAEPGQTVIPGTVLAREIEGNGQFEAGREGTVYVTEQLVLVRPAQEGYVLVSDRYLLGADNLGRDLLSRLLYGARVSLLVALVGPAVSLLIGLPYGLFSGYLGGKVDNLLMRFVDIMYAFPNLLLIILLMAFFRASYGGREAAAGSFTKMMSDLDTAMGGMWFIFIGIGVTSWMGLARLTRGQVLSLREMEFVVAAKATGAKTPRIMWRHILPNALGPIIVNETLSIPTYIRAEAFLSFIGLGVNAPTPSWGMMIADGREVLRSYPHLALFPALALFLIMFAFNFLGDGLRDALDPRMRGVD